MCIRDSLQVEWKRGNAATANSLLLNQVLRANVVVNPARMVIKTTKQQALALEEVKNPPPKPAAPPIAGFLAICAGFVALFLWLKRRTSRNLK